MGDLSVFFDASFGINELMVFGLTEPISKVTSGVCGSPDEHQWIHVLILD